MGDIPRHIPGDVTFFVTGRGVSRSSCSAGGPWGPHWALPWSCHSSASLHPKAVISRGWHGSWARLPTCRRAGFGLLRQGCAELAWGLLLWGTVGWLPWARGCRARCQAGPTPAAGTISQQGSAPCRAAGSHLPGLCRASSAGTAPATASPRPCPSSRTGARPVARWAGGCKMQLWKPLAGKECSGTASGAARAAFVPF